MMARPRRDFRKRREDGWEKGQKPGFVVLRGSWRNWKTSKRAKWRLTVSTGLQWQGPGRVGNSETQENASGRVLFV